MVVFCPPPHWLASADQPVIDRSVIIVAGQLAVQYGGPGMGAGPYPFVLDDQLPGVALRM